jgi:hypothetical protein
MLLQEKLFAISVIMTLCNSGKEKKNYIVNSTFSFSLCCRDHTEESKFGTNQPENYGRLAKRQETSHIWRKSQSLPRKKHPEIGSWRITYPPPHPSEV